MERLPAAAAAGPLRRSAVGLLSVSLTMGLIRSVWHLPLVVARHIPWYDAVFFSFAFQFLISCCSIALASVCFHPCSFTSPRTSSAVR